MARSQLREIELRVLLEEEKLNVVALSEVELAERDSRLLQGAQKEVRII